MITQYNIKSIEITYDLYTAYLFSDTPKLKYSFKELPTEYKMLLACSGLSGVLAFFFKEIIVPFQANKVKFHDCFQSV